MGSNESRCRCKWNPNNVPSIIARAAGGLQNVTNVFAEMWIEQTKERPQSNSWQFLWPTPYHNQPFFKLAAWVLLDIGANFFLKRGANKLAPHGGANLRESISSAAKENEHTSSSFENAAPSKSPQVPATRWAFKSRCFHISVFPRNWPVDESFLNSRNTIFQKITSLHDRRF